jgi:hypothetical protein
MSIEYWHYGWDGLLAKILQRASWDYAVATEIGLLDVSKYAKRPSCSLRPEICRHTLACGFETPLQELKVFFDGERLHEWLRLCDVNPESVIERILSEQKGAR